MWGQVAVKTPGAVPVTAADMRLRQRLGDDTAEDALWAEFLGAAAALIEGPNGRGLALMAQTWTRTLDAWPDVIRLPGWPVTGVAEIRYLDRDEAAQVLDLSAVRLVTGAHPARLVRVAAASWPVVLSGPAVIEVDYTLGRAAVADVDQGLLTALKLIAAHYYENREAAAPGALHKLPLGVEYHLARFCQLSVA